MNAAVWFLIGILQSAPAPVAEFYPETFTSKEECLATGGEVKIKGYKNPMACIGLQEFVPVGDPT